MSETTPILKHRPHFGWTLIFISLLFPHSARANCVSALSDFDTGVCQAQDYWGADALLNETYQRLYDTLSTAKQLDLRHDELAWIDRRNENCSFVRDGTVFISFECAARLTQARTLLLMARLAAPVAALSYNGRYTVMGTAMPWLWHAGGLNNSFEFWHSGWKRTNHSHVERIEGAGWADTDNKVSFRRG